MTSYLNVLDELKSLENPVKAAFLQKYFKTGTGEYGEHDLFLGVMVPDQRKISKKHYGSISEEELYELLQSPFHEVRLTAVFMLVSKYEKVKTYSEKEKWVEFYVKNRNKINNWDLVDSSAPRILGPWLFDKDRSLLYDLAKSGKLWDQRIAILATYHFIRNNDFSDTLKIAEILLHHPHELIHKAVGWMIREVGNRDYEVAYLFLRQHYLSMPRTMLRYSIEKFDPEIRKRFLKGDFI